MNDLKKKFAIRIARKDFWFDFFLFLLLSVSDFFLGCLTFDASRLDQMTQEDYYVYSVLGLTGITVQSYFFPFACLVALLFSLMVLYSFLSVSSLQGDCFLLRMKGFVRPDGFVRKVHFLKLIVQSLLSVFLYFLIYSLMNLIFRTSIPIFTFNLNVLYLSLSYILVNQAVYSIVLKHKMKNRDVLKFLRERY